MEYFFMNLLWAELKVMKRKTNFNRNQCLKCRGIWRVKLESTEMYRVFVLDLTRLIELVD